MNDIMTIIDNVLYEIISFVKEEEINHIKCVMLCKYVSKNQLRLSVRTLEKIREYIYKSGYIDCIYDFTKDINNKELVASSSIVMMDALKGEQFDDYYDTYFSFIVNCVEKEEERNKMIKYFFERPEFEKYIDYIKFQSIYKTISNHLHNCCYEKNIPDIPLEDIIVNCFSDECDDPFLKAEFYKNLLFTREKGTRFCWDIEKLNDEQKNKIINNLVDALEKIELMYPKAVEIYQNFPSDNEEETYVVRERICKRGFSSKNGIMFDICRIMSIMGCFLLKLNACYKVCKLTTEQSEKLAAAYISIASVGDLKLGVELSLYDEVLLKYLVKELISRNEIGFLLSCEADDRTKNLTKEGIKTLINDNESNISCFYDYIKVIFNDLSADEQEKVRQKIKKENNPNNIIDFASTMDEDFMVSYYGNYDNFFASVDLSKVKKIKTI